MLLVMLIQVPEGHVWLQGDNTINSTDSRHYGPVPYAMLVGKAFLKVIPEMPTLLVCPWGPVQSSSVPN